jgi:hypothetical protein
MVKKMQLAIDKKNILSFFIDYLKILLKILAYSVLAPYLCSPNGKLGFDYVSKN